MKIFGKGSKLYSIFGLKCPTCHEGDLFETGSFTFKKPFEMHQKCDHCGQNYWPEPGFYYGAMFISYIFTAWFCLFFIMFFHWVLDWSLGASFGLLLAVCALFFVYFFRLARSIWLNINFKHNPNKAN
ncbi:MAG: DUF983 domain-containing protein [Lewinellaceae bacterium]|nr:DUF983 domain-containing protein [Lewinellaceae bacterium]